MNFQISKDYILLNNPVPKDVSQGKPNPVTVAEAQAGVAQSIENIRVPSAEFYRKIKGFIVTPIPNPSI